MSNAEQRNPVTRGVRKPPEDPTGFIDHSYRAAGGTTQTVKPLMEEAKQGTAYVTTAVGGSLASVSFEEAGTVSRASRPTRRGGGIRGKVRGFSRTSRRNLHRVFASVNRTAFRAFEGRVYFITVTCPGAGPPWDPAAAKGCLKSLRKRLERRFGKFACVWRMGIQRRGAIHFHLILFVPPGFGTLSGLRRFVARAWYEACGGVSEGHLCAGTNVEAVRGWKRVTSAAERYTARREEFPVGLETGRIWGVWSEAFLPVNWETVALDLRDGFRLRRVLRRLARRGGTGSLSRATVLVRHENVVRLLEFLGYRLE